MYKGHTFALTKIRIIRKIRRHYRHSAKQKTGLTHILHPARNIIYITFAAILCGLRGWEDIADFDHGKKKLSIKRKMLKALLNQKYLEHLLSRL